MKLTLCIFALVASAMTDSDLEEVLKAGNDQFTAKMFQEVVKSQGDKSVVLSAFSVLSPLAQLALASAPETHDEILKTIGFANDNDTKQVFTNVNKRLRLVSGVELKQANKVYIRDGYILNDKFAAISKDVFDSEVQNIDFKKPAAAAREINAWVEDHTNKRIKDLVDPNSIDSNTAAILVNAIYFKGQWKNMFKKELTQDRDFHLTKDKSISIPMMYQSGDFKYGESQELDAKVLEMNYVGDETSFIVVLPNQIDGIKDLIAKLQDPAALNKALENMSTQEVQVTLPKFKIETTTNLKEVLNNMNIKRLFHPNQAKLDNLLAEVKDLFVSDATQKAFIEVNEEGAEAAAANAFVVGFGSAFNPDIKEFNADHPFVFFLMEKKNILFNGVFKS